MFIGKALGVDDSGNFKAMRLIRKVGKSIGVIEIRDRDEQEPIMASIMASINVLLCMPEIKCTFTLIAVEAMLKTVSINIIAFSSFNLETKISPPQKKSIKKLITSLMGELWNSEFFNPFSEIHMILVGLVERRSAPIRIC